MIFNPVTRKHRHPTEAEWAQLLSGVSGQSVGAGPSGGATEALQQSQLTAANSIADRIGAIDAPAAASDSAAGPVASLIRRLLARLTVLIDRQPAQPPQQGSGPVSSGTLRVTMATDGPMVSSVGAQSDAAASSDTGAFSLIALIKRVASNITSLLTATSSFRPIAATVTVAVSSSGTSAIALPAGSVIRFSNAGSSAYAVAFGDAAMSINVDTAMDILPGSAESITPPAGTTHMRLITAAGVTATAKYTGGTGA